MIVDERIDLINTRLDTEPIRIYLAVTRRVFCLYILGAVWDSSRKKMIAVDDRDKIDTVILQVPTDKQIRQIEDLYRSQGWWYTSDSEGSCLIPRLVTGSHCFVVAIKKGDVIGMGRAISDGVSDAYIQDMIVRSDCRNQGIGQRILRVLLERLHAEGLRWIGLIAEPGSDNLYRRSGFRKMPSWIPMLMNSKP